jgi:hypothetical protein
MEDIEEVATPPPYDPIEEVDSDSSSQNVHNNMGLDNTGSVESTLSKPIKDGAIAACLVTATTRLSFVSPSGYDESVPVQPGCYGISMSEPTSLSTLCEQIRFAPSRRIINVIETEEYGDNLNCSPIATGLLGLIAIVKKTQNAKFVVIYTDSAISTNALDKHLKTENKTDVDWSNIHKNEYIDLFAKINVLLYQRRLIHEYNTAACRSIEDMSGAFGVKIVVCSTTAPKKTKSSFLTSGSQYEATPFVLAELTSMHRVAQQCISDIKSKITEHMGAYLTTLQQQQQ